MEPFAIDRGFLMTGIVRWGVVSTGRMAATMVADFALTQNASVRAVLSRTQERAQAAATEWGIDRAFSDYDDMLAQDDIDAIYIASPHPAHFEQARRALEAGKHVLVEKPITMRANQARELAQIATANDRFLMEAMWMLFNPAIREALRLVQAGEIGDVRLVQAQFGVPFPFEPQGRLWDPVLGGGTVLDQGIYPLSLIHAVCGVPNKIQTVGSIGPTTVDTEAVVVMDFPGAKRGVCISSMVSHTNLTATISGSLGHIQIHRPFWNTTRLTIDRSGWRPPEQVSSEWSFTPEGSGYVPMLRSVSQSILDGERANPTRTMEATIEVMDIIDTVLDDINEGSVPTP
jgi:predicted dehydrogenase